jgi:hypothetical protein
MRELIINKGTGRKPDYWLLSMGDFTDEELAEVSPAMKKLKIQIWPEGVSVRWGTLYGKDELLSALRKQLPAKRARV